VTVRPTRESLIVDLQAEHRRLHDAIDAGYWAFTRQARGRLLPASVYRARTAAATKLRQLGARPA
jgi:hypothetical protein